MIAVTCRIPCAVRSEHGREWRCIRRLVLAEDHPWSVFFGLPDVGLLLAARPALRLSGVSTDPNQGNWRQEARVSPHLAEEKRHGLKKQNKNENDGENDQSQSAARVPCGGDLVFGSALPTRDLSD